MLRTTRPTTDRRPAAPPARPRAGFTLVELLVGAALTILMMAVVATAFQVALRAYSDLNAVSVLSDHLRAVDAVMTRDLEADHLWDADKGKAVRVSEVPAYALTTPGYPGWTAPWQHGYFSVRQASAPSATNPAAPYYEEGSDGTPKRSYRATDHVLAMTVRLDGDKPEHAFTAKVPVPPVAQGAANDLVNNPSNLKDLDPTQVQFASRWAEVRYYLTPTALTTAADPATGVSALPLFTLRRRQWVLTPGPVVLKNDPANGLVMDPTQFSSQFPDLSVNDENTSAPQQWRTNSPQTVTNPNNRNGGVRLPPSQSVNLALAAGHPEGADVLLSNVVSFQVRVSSEANTAGNPIWFHPTVSPPTVGPPPGATAVAPFDFHDLGLWVHDYQYAGANSAQPVTFNSPASPATFDTATSLVGIPLPPPTAAGQAHPTQLPAGQTQVIRQVRAVEVTVRVYDFKTHHTRQITIKKDL